MSKPVEISVKESKEELQKLIRNKGAHNRPKLKMLIAILGGMHKNTDLSAHTGSGLRSIIRWKQQYQEGGIKTLLEDKRGHAKPTALNKEHQDKLYKKLSDPKNGFTSYKMIVSWIEEELGVKMEYGAAYMFLRRRYGTKLKVGRKSHIKKDDEAVAFFKKHS